MPLHATMWTIEIGHIMNSMMPLRFSRLGVCSIFWSFQSMSKLWWTSALWSGYFMNNKKKVELGVASVHGVGWGSPPLIFLILNS